MVKPLAIITTEALKEMDALVAGAYPAEACGIVLGRSDSSIVSGQSACGGGCLPLKDSHSYHSGQSACGDCRILRVQDLRNSTAGGRANVYFEIDPLELYRIEQLAGKEGMEILGIFHSHPDKPARPSSEDVKYMIPGMLYLIAAGTKDGMTDIRGYVKDKPDGGVSDVGIQEEREL